jgi:hypothetical protein
MVSILNLATILRKIKQKRILYGECVPGPLAVSVSVSPAHVWWFATVSVSPAHVRSRWVCPRPTCGDFLGECVPGPRVSRWVCPRPTCGDFEVLTPDSECRWMMNTNPIWFLRQGSLGLDLTGTYARGNRSLRLCKTSGLGFLFLLINWINA